MDKKVLTLEVHDEGTDGYWAEVKELPGCFASGFTLDELYECLEEGISLYLSSPEHKVTVRLAGVRHGHERGVVEEQREFELCPV